MSWIEDCELEPLVREAMQARPQPRSISNLAYRAMELAREHARTLARRQLDSFLRLRRRGRWIGAVATMLIAIIVWIGVRDLSNSLAAMSISTTATSPDGPSSDSTSSGNNTLGIVLTADLIVVAMILLSAEASSRRGDTLI